MFTEYADHDGLGLADLIRRGQISASEVLEAAIARIEVLPSSGTPRQGARLETTRPRPERLSAISGWAGEAMSPSARLRAASGPSRSGPD